MKFFGMITTEASKAYTPYALESFFRTTPFGTRDRFILIDNDGAYQSEAATLPSEVTMVKPETPRSFAANVNSVMELAEEARADIYFLNNDLIFTEGWLYPLLVSEVSILSPLSNREVQHESDGFIWGNVLSLDDYLPRRERFEALVRLHAEKWHGYRDVISLPFFCIKIPYLVYSIVGRVDESFGRGGAEDDDYCIRAYLAGCRVKYALESFVLHFSGRSTWAGTDGEAETTERVTKFRAVFREKWGARAYTLLMEQNASIIDTHPDLLDAAHKGNFRLLTERLVHEGPRS